MPESSGGGPSQLPSVIAPQDAGAPLPAGVLDRGTLDRATLERVLARAAALQTAAGDDAEPTEGLSEQQLLDIGREVGLSATHLRQALAEERTRILVPPEDGIVAQMAGAASASAHRTVPGSPPALLATLNQVMLRDECLTVRRRYGDRMTWEPRRDFWAAFRRLAPAAGHSYDLLRAREVAATVVPLDETRSLVRLDADVSHARSQRLYGGIALATVGLGIGAAILGSLTAIIGTPLLPALILGAVPAGLGVAGFAAIARTHRHTVARAQLSLEQVLDRLEQGDTRRPHSFFDMLTSG